MKITFIGGGNMGEAMLAAVLRRGLVSAGGDITVSDVSEVRRNHLSEKFGVNVTGNNREAAGGSDIVVLAIKPQILTDVMTELKDSLDPDQLVMSIIAGARIETISRGLNHKRIVRVMPNTPAQIGAGASAWTATGEVSSQQKTLAGEILGSMGSEIFFGDEKYLDMATAVSGSGPAYLFLLAESMIDAALDIGLSRNDARTLVLQTLLGSARLLSESDKPPDELRRNVTSPGGTTAAAIKAFEEGGFSGLVREAVRAAYHRAEELGK